MNVKHIKNMYLRNNTDKLDIITLYETLLNSNNRNYIVYRLLAKLQQSVVNNN